MLSILSTLVPVFGIILFGIVVERMGFLPIETSGCLNQFVYWIGLPMMLFNQLARMEAGQMSGGMVGGILLGYGITYLFAYVLFSNFLRRRWEESSVFALLSSFRMRRSWGCRLWCSCCRTVPRPPSSPAFAR